MSPRFRPVGSARWGRIITVVVATLCLTPAVAHACVWFPQHYFSPLPPCPVKDKAVAKGNATGGVVAFAGKLPMYVRRYQAVRQEVALWTATYTEAKAFGDRVHGFMGSLRGLQAPNPLNALVAEYNREAGQMRYLYDQKSQQYGLVGLQAFVDSAATRFLTDTAAYYAQFAQQRGTRATSRWVEGWRLTQEERLKTIPGLVRKAQATRDSIDKYALQLDSMVTRRSDVDGQAEAIKTQMAAQVFELRAMSASGKATINRLRGEAMLRSEETRMRIQRFEARGSFLRGFTP